LALHFDHGGAQRESIGGASEIALDALNEPKMAYPVTTPKRRKELESIRKLLVN